MILARANSHRYSGIAAMVSRLRYPASIHQKGAGYACCCLYKAIFILAPAGRTVGALGPGRYIFCRARPLLLQVEVIVFVAALVGRVKVLLVPGR